MNCLCGIFTCYKDISSTHILYYNYRPNYKIDAEGGGHIFRYTYIKYPLETKYIHIMVSLTYNKYLFFSNIPFKFKKTLIRLQVINF